MMAMTIKDSTIYKKLFNDKNIYLALYSVESYITNRELLSSKDKKKLEQLKDKFNEKNIRYWINLVKKRLEKIIDNDEYLETKVYFKPKSYKDNRVDFRPVHTATLLDQIAIVAMLNILIYDIEDSKITMSNLSRLIPHNFYGNRVAYQPEKLFKPWQDQYKEYTTKANELYRKFHENREYKWEISLDLKNFFPSINPISLYNYILEMIPVNIENEDKEMFSLILKKLIFIKLNSLNKQDMKNYSGENNVECIFAKGLPQGLPQCYFLANLLMIKIEEFYKEEFQGKMLFYVDDSVIFTNDLVDPSSLDEKIVQLNKKIEEWIKKMYKNNKYLDNVLCDEVKRIEKLYKIEIHGTDHKSTATNIIESKEGEIYLHCIGRETSKTSFDMNTSFSDDQSKMLKNKIECILNAIEKEMDRLNGKEESYKKKIIRYKKFFKYRLKELTYREECEIENLITELEADLDFDEKNPNESLKRFFEKYNEDTLAVSITFVLRKMKELNEDRTEIIKKIRKLNRNIYGNDNTETSFLLQSIREFEKKGLEKELISEYSSLEILIRKKHFSTEKINDLKRIDVLNEILKKEDQKGIFNEYFNKDFYEIISLVCSNSQKPYRMLLNSIASYLLKYNISDETILHKTNNRKITYAELRLLEYLRNKEFDFVEFNEIKKDIFKDDYKYPIDYSIFQVLSIFKTFICEPSFIDNLILIHKYTCDVWKNGSKHLYFYTLHNQEHAVDLIQNSVAIIRAIDYLDISKLDYYVLFIACYLHDISMVSLPDMDVIQLDTYESNELYYNFVRDIKAENDKSSLSKSPVKKLMKDYYLKLDSFYESIVRDNHAKNSAYEIRNRDDLSFIDDSIRDIIAEISEAHCQDVRDVYKLRSDGKSSVWNKKLTKIILRFADLLDMSNYRVSKRILNHNLDNMSETSCFHWLSHLITSGYRIETEYELAEDISTENEEISFLKKKMIKEILNINIDVELPQLTKEESNNCTDMSLTKITDNGIVISVGKKCENSDKCNFMCKWFRKKNYYLFKELAALNTYLIDLDNNYFSSEIKVNVESKHKNSLTPEQFTKLRNYVNRN